MFSRNLKRLSTPRLGGPDKSLCQVQTGNKDHSNLPCLLTPSPTRQPDIFPQGTRNQVPGERPHNRFILEEAAVTPWKFEWGKNKMFVSTNYPRKGWQPGQPGIICVLVFWILNKMVNLEEIGRHVIQFQPKWHSVPPWSSLARMSSCWAWALTFFYKGRLEVWEQQQLWEGALDPQEGALDPQEEVPFSAKQWRAKWPTTARPGRVWSFCWFFSSKSVYK